MYSIHPLYTALPLYSWGLPSYHKVIRIALNWMTSQDHLGFIILGNQIIIDYVGNQIYILTANKTRQIQVIYLLNLRYVFKYPTTVNIIKYNNIYYSILLKRRLRVQITPSSGSRVEHLLLHVYWSKLEIVLDTLFVLSCPTKFTGLYCTVSTFAAPCSS